MELAIHLGNENKCPKCRQRGILWDYWDEEVNVYGSFRRRKTVVYQCFRGHEQELFAVRTEKIITN